MRAVYYTPVFKKDLLLVANDVLSNMWILQQDKALIQTTAHTRNWLHANEINMMELI